MVVPVRRVFAYAPVLVLALLVASPSVQAACQTAEEGKLLVPSGLASPPPELSGLNHGVNVWLLDVYLPGTRYTLSPMATKSSFCLPSEPCPVRFVLPDLNVAWFTSDWVQIANHNGVGDEAGAIPLNAAHGVVYMSTGPDWTLFDGPFSDGDVGARFQFFSGCP